MKQQSTGRGFAYLSAAELLVKVMSLLYVPMLIGILGGEGHGVYAKAYEAFTFIYVLTNEGIQRGVSKLISELYALDNPKDALRAFRLSRTMLIFGGLLASLLLFFMAPIIASWAATPDATLALQALAPTVLITSVLSAYRGYFLGRSYITANALSKIVEQLVNVVASLLGAYFLMKVGLVFGVAGGTFGTSIGALAAVGLLIHEFYKGRLHKVRRQDQSVEAYRHSAKELMGKLFQYSFPITVTAGLMHFGGFVDMLVVSNRLLVAGLSEDLANAAYSQLSAFRTLLSVPNTIIISLALVLLPGLSSAAVLKNKEEVQRKVAYSVKMVFMVTLPAFVGMTVLAKPIYALLFPYTGGVEMLAYGSITVVFLGFIQIQNTLYQGVGKFYWATATMMVGILVRLSMNYVLVAIPEINVFGAVISHFANYFIPFVINHYLLTKVLKFKIPLMKNAAKPLVSALGMGGVLFLLARLTGLFSFGRWVNGGITLFLVFVGIGVYGVLMLLMGGVTKEELQDISPRLYGKIPSGIRKHMK